MEFNFNNTKKKYLKITLNDDEKTILFLKTPRKDLMNKLLSLNTDNKNMDEEELDQVYEITAEIMSRNTKNKKITKEEVEELLDFEDIYKFIVCYTEFLIQVTKQKNYKSPITRKKK